MPSAFDRLHMSNLPSSNVRSADAGVTHPATNTSFARSQQRSLMDNRNADVIIAKTLAKPPVREPRAADHEWSPLQLVCVACGMTVAAFYNQPIPCLDQCKGA